MKITRVADRIWENSTFDPKAKKVSYFDGRSSGQGRTLLSRYEAGQCVAPQKSAQPWDIFVLSGDLTVNGEALGSGDHALLAANESVSFSSINGSESLIFVRGTHEWCR